MTEMVYGSMPVTGERAGASPLVAHDRQMVADGGLGAVRRSGLLLGLAASVPLAERNGLDPFYYVQRQAFFGGLALVAMLGAVDDVAATWCGGWGCWALSVSFVALALLPVFGTDFGKGAVRWFSLGFASVQPSEFLKPGFVIADGLADGGQRRI